MSDTGRRGLSDKAGAALKPDSQKSTGEQIKDYTKGKTDSAASTLQPESQKSASQKLGDTSSDNQNQRTESTTDTLL